MNKVLFVSEQELVNLMEEHFDVKADNNVVSVVEDGEEITKDVIELYPTEKSESKLITLISEKLNISESDIIKTNSKEHSIILMVDFIDLKTLLEEKYNTRLTSNYEPCECNLFKNTMIAFEMK